MNPSSLFQTGGGVAQAERVFGRDFELNRIVEQELRNYVLVGGRQVGKSSLLNAIEIRLRNRRDIECIRCSLFDHDLVGELGRVLGLTKGASLGDVVERLRRPKAPATIVLVDEADLFISLEARDNFGVISQLKQISEERKAFFVLAGCWTLYNSFASGKVPQLSNFGEVLRLGPIDIEAAREFALNLLESVGVRFESLALIDRIHEKTGGHPHLLAIVYEEAQRLNLQCSERIITADHVDRALTSDAVDDALALIVSRSADGADGENEYMLHRQCIFEAAREQSFAELDILTALRKRNCKCTLAGIRSALSRMELAIMIRKTASGDYEHSVPLLFETESVAMAFEDYETEEVK